MISKQRPRLPYILLILCSVAAALIVLFRVPFGVDVTDTSYWIAEPYRTVLGAVPFSDNLSLLSLAYLLIAPFVKLFISITGGTEGLMLFMFYVSFFFRLAIPVLTWFILRKRMEPFWAAIFCLLFFVYDYGLNQNLNYNFMSLALLVLGGALLWSALGQENPRSAAIRYAFAGFVMAMCALAHTTQILNCFLFGVVLLVLERRRWGKLPCWLPYALTGLTAAALTIVGLEAAGGGGVFSGLFVLLTQNNYLRIPSSAITWQFFYVIVNCMEIFPLVCFPFAGILAIYLTVFYRRGGQAIRSGLMAALAGGCGLCFLFYAIAYLNGFQNQNGFRSYVYEWIRIFKNGEFAAVPTQPLLCLYLFVCFPAGILAAYLIVLYRRERQAILPGLMAALAGGCGFCCLFYAIAYVKIIQNGEALINVEQPLVLCLFLTAPVWFVLLPRQDRRQFLPGFLFIWTASFVSFIGVVVASFTSANARYTFLIGGALLSLPLAAKAFKTHASQGLFPSGVYMVLLLFLAVSVAFSALSRQYAYVYRDGLLSTLTCRVERGVYKGLYTTPERAEALQDLEEQLKARVSQGEAVLFADLMPTAYLMTDGLSCTPNSWDPCYYRYGFQDDDLYQYYFEMTGRVPDKIFFIQSEERPLSIDDPENEFAAWVHTNYTLTETVGEGRFSFRLFTKDS